MNAPASSTPLISSSLTTLSPKEMFAKDSRREDLAIAGRKVTTYTPVKRDVGTLWCQMATLQEKLHPFICTAVLQHNGLTPIFKVNPLPEFAKIGKQYLQEYQGTDAKTRRQIKLLTEQSQMSKDELLQSAQKAISLMEEFLKLKRGAETGGLNIVPFQVLGSSDPREMTGNFFTFPIGPNRKEYLENWEKDYTTELYKFWYSKIGVTQIGKVTLTEDDQRLLKGSDADHKLPAAADISCATYALLKAKSPLAKEVSSNAEYGKLSFWESKGYGQVDEPRGGDLALYMNSKGEILHIGYVMPNLKILSKPVVNHPYAYLHNIFDFIGMYQWNVIFLRQNSSAQNPSAQR